MKLMQILIIALMVVGLPVVAADDKKVTATPILAMPLPGHDHETAISPLSASSGSRHPSQLAVDSERDAHRALHGSSLSEAEQAKKNVLDDCSFQLEYIAGESRAFLLSTQPDHKNRIIDGYIEKIEFEVGKIREMISKYGRSEDASALIKTANKIYVELDGQRLAIPDAEDSTLEHEPSALLRVSDAPDSISLLGAPNSSPRSQTQQQVSAIEMVQADAARSSISISSALKAEQAERHKTVLKNDKRMERIAKWAVGSVVTALIAAAAIYYFWFKQPAAVAR